jgi:hypothetical protein
VTISTSSSNIKGFADSNDEDSIWKKPIRISDNMMVVAIPESIVQKLHINEQDTWFELIPTSDQAAIILKICSKKVGSSHIVEASRV